MGHTPHNVVVVIIVINLHLSRLIACDGYKQLTRQLELLALKYL